MKYEFKKFFIYYKFKFFKPIALVLYFNLNTVKPIVKRIDCKVVKRIDCKGPFGWFWSPHILYAKLQDRHTVPFDFKLNKTKLRCSLHASALYVKCKRLGLHSDAEHVGYTIANEAC